MFRTALCRTLGPAVCLSVVSLVYPTADQGRAAAWNNSYYQTLDRYCAGGFSAVGEVLAWTADDVERARDATGAGILNLPHVTLDGRRKMAAAALHVEVVAAQWRDEHGRVLMNHGMLARDLANESRHAGSGPRGLVRSWALAWGYLLLSHVRFAEAEQHFATARTWFPQDADFIVASGIVSELQASPLGQQTRGSLMGSLAAVDAQRFRGRAVSLYRAALDMKPDHAEAHLRVGRMLFLSGDEPAAAAEFDRALALSSDRRLVHLARLFLGALVERQGRLEEAERQYEMAAATVPGAQTATLAVTALRIRMGRGTAVPALVVEYDPWHDYLFSRPYRFQQSIGELRESACR
jgi:tetratricopeptide (TPR) repeat protein